MFHTLLYPTSNNSVNVDSPNTLSFTITGNKYNLNLWDFLVGEQADAATFNTFNITIDTNAVIGGGNSAYSLRTGSFPAGATLTITNNGKIIGKGGNGGDYTAGTGGAGGTAILFNGDATIVNNGLIAAGGGGGGGGSINYASYDGDFESGTAVNVVVRQAVGGGGAGFPAGLSGRNSTNDRYEDLSGTRNAGALVPLESDAGDGGNLNTAGSNGSGGGTGGAKGDAIHKNGNTVTVTNNGTITGDVSATT